LKNSTPAFFTAPYAAISKALKRKRADKGLRVEAGKDRFEVKITLLQGVAFYCEISAKDSDAALYALSTDIEPF
jgi:hypothetical protein